MSCKWLALSLCIFCIYIFVFKVHSNFSGKICIHSYHVFFRDGINWSQTKVHNSIVIRSLFFAPYWRILFTPRDRHTVHKPTMQMETLLLTVSSIGKYSVILTSLNWRSITQKKNHHFFFTFTFTILLTRIWTLLILSHKRSIIASHYWLCLYDLCMDLVFAYRIIILTDQKT